MGTIRHGHPPWLSQPVSTTWMTIFYGGHDQSLNKTHNLHQLTTTIDINRLNTYDYCRLFKYISYSYNVPKHTCYRNDQNICKLSKFIAPAPHKGTRASDAKACDDSPLRYQEMLTVWVSGANKPKQNATPLWTVRRRFKPQSHCCAGIDWIHSAKLSYNAIDCWTETNSWTFAWVGRWPCIHICVCLHSRHHHFFWSTAAHGKNSGTSRLAHLSAQN